MPLTGSGRVLEAGVAAEVAGRFEPTSEVRVGGTVSAGVVKIADSTERRVA